MTLDGIDISHWQTGLDVADTDAQFVIIKVTDGQGYIDPQAVAFARDIIDAGLPGGGYHFYEGAGTAVAQREADNFVDRMAPVIGRALLALDFEHSTTDVAGAKAFLDRVYARTGVRPLIYMSQSLTNAHDWSAVAKDYGLWVARYNDVIGPTGPWDDVTIWQYTDAHHTGGMSVDGDHFYGDRDTWRALAGNIPVDPEEPEMKYTTHSSHNDQAVPDDGDWHSLHIDDDKHLTILSSECHFILTATVYVDGLPAGAELDLRAVLVATKGDTTTAYNLYPQAEHRGGSGQAQMQYAMQGHIPADDGHGADVRLRLQARTWSPVSVAYVSTKVTSW